MEKPGRHKLIAIDGNSLLYRAFFAMKYLSTSEGQPTNAIYGFTMMLLRLLEEERPDSILVAWDAPAKTFRHVEYEKYKAQRKPVPDDLRAQAPIVREIVEAFRIPMIEVEGFEADDVVATIARQACKEGYETLIVTGDLDALQLVDDCVSVMTTVKGVSETVVYDAEAVLERYGIPPEAMADFKALKGDPSDNIPGVPGVGDKTAARLVQQFGSVENMLEHIEEIEDPKLRAAIESSSEQILQSKKLVKLITDAPIEFHVRDCGVREPDWNRLRELFINLEFKTLLKRIPEPAPAAAEHPGAEPPSRGHIVSSDEDLRELLDKLSQAPEVTVLPLVTSSKPSEAELLGLVLSMGAGNTYYVPIEAPGEVEGTLDFGPAERAWSANISAFSGFLSDSSKAKMGHDLKILFGVLKARGVEMSGLAFDTMLGAYVLSPGRASYRIPDLALEYLSLELPQASSSSPARRPGKAREEAGNGPDAEEIICAEAEAVYRLVPILRERLEQDQLFALFNDVEMPLIPILAEMELYGVAVDRNVLEEISSGLEQRIKELEQKIYEEAGTDFNIGSTKQLQTILYDKLGIQATKKTKTGFSTDAETLAELAPAYPIVDYILQYRELTKLKSTYADALPKLINPKTGKIHTSLNQAVTATGRLSSSDPNLQNIPIRTEVGRELRKAFIASNDNLLMSADYSQIELRILAHITHDPALVEAFMRDEDIHKATACTLFGVAPEDVTPEMRRSAKTVNFAVIYGMSDYGLARQLQIPTHVAREYIQNYFAKLPGVKRYAEQTLAFAREHGYVSTLFGRRRYIQEINSTNRQYRLFAERAAVNMPIQGTAADIMKMAMVRAHRCLKEMDSKTRMVLQVHDELVFEVPPEELDRIASAIRGAMENAATLDIPLKVEVKAGKNWAETEIVHGIDQRI